MPPPRTSQRPRSRYASPAGVPGWVLGHFMARLTAEANRWTIALLDVEPVDRVLDVGCGPGVGVTAAAQVAPDGLVVGVDTSSTMVRHASRRNRAGIRDGQVEIHRADATRLPLPDRRFTKASSLNSLQFWPDAGAGLRELHRVLVPGGRVAIVLMARTDDPSEPDVPGWARELGDEMVAAGFEGLSHRRRRFGGVLHWAFLARRPERPVAPAT